MLLLKKNGDYGWPECYYDAFQQKLVLAPEYGGDGKKVDQCAQKKEPVATFPGHWAPNALFFYSGSMFPARYKDGAFIAFHGSWNRSPLPEAGYNVMFQPLRGHVADGPAVVFADGFAGTSQPTPGSAQHRPVGLAESPDGGLYMSDDVGGRIWKIVYIGDR